MDLTHSWPRSVEQLVLQLASLKGLEPSFWSCLWSSLATKSRPCTKKNSKNSLMKTIGQSCHFTKKLYNNSSYSVEITRHSKRILRILRSLRMLSGITITMRVEQDQTQNRVNNKRKVWLKAKMLSLQMRSWKYLTTSSISMEKRHLRWRVNRSPSTPFRRKLLRS